MHKLSLCLTIVIVNLSTKLSTEIPWRLRVFQSMVAMITFTGDHETLDTLLARMSRANFTKSIMCALACVACTHVCEPTGFGEYRLRLTACTRTGESPSDVSAFMYECGPDNPQSPPHYACRPPSRPTESGLLRHGRRSAHTCTRLRCRVDDDNVSGKRVRPKRSCGGRGGGAGRIFSTCGWVQVRVGSS